MLIIILIIVLVLSFLLHTNFGYQYVTTRKKKYLTLYLNTAVSNMLVAGALIYVSLTNPGSIRGIDPKVLFWILSGLVLVVTLKIKISIFRKIYLRAQEPENFHYNFFGKKVLHSSVVKPTYIVGFFASMPFFLFAGAYFVARLINVFLYGHL